MKTRRQRSINSTTKTLNRNREKRDKLTLTQGVAVQVRTKGRKRPIDVDGQQKDSISTGIVTIVALEASIRGILKTPSGAAKTTQTCQLVQLMHNQEYLWREMPALIRQSSEFGYHFQLGEHPGNALDDLWNGQCI